LCGVIVAVVLGAGVVWNYRSKAAAATVAA
jgi:hypothetical protein